MSEALKKSNQMSSEDSRNAISSPALESGLTPCVSPAGPTLDLFGQEVAPVRVFQPPVKAKGLKTLATSGLVGLASSASQDLQRSLGSRLIRQLDSAGSTLFKQTWKRRVTPLGRRYLEHTASARRTSDNGFTSLPTPNTPSGGPNRISTATHTGGMDLEGAASLASVPTPMAGTPAQKGYNEAGSTDYARKIVSLASTATPMPSVEFDPRNVWGICGPCNFRHETVPRPMHDAVLMRLGERSYADLCDLAKALTQLCEIQKLILEHQQKQNHQQGFGTPAQKIKAILREYEDKTVRAYNGAIHARDDMLTFFRALALVLTMTGEAQTHAEKNARLRGAIELLESAIEKLRHQSFEQLFDVYRFPDLFRSDWPTRRLMERIHDLERQVKELQPNGNEAEGPDADTIADTEPRW